MLSLTSERPRRRAARSIFLLAVLATSVPSAIADPLPPWGATRPEPRTLPGGDLQRAVFRARDSVLPALVHVEPIIELYRRGQKSKAAVTGSGVIVSAQGHVLTNDHVVAHASRVTCTLHDRREFQARVLGRDTFTDVALLQLELEGESVPHAELGRSSHLTAGQFVIAMGSPLGLARSISLGVVSTPDRYFPEDFLPSGEITGTYNTWIQTDAAINPGNSGGPLVDLSGRVVGINARAVQIFGENLGFAIPIDVVNDVAAELVARGRVDRSWIGVRWQHMKALADYFGAGDRGGVLVGGLVPNGPGADAGFLPGDVLISWNGRPVSVRFEEELPIFRKVIADTGTGRDIAAVVLRQGQELRLTVRPELRPDADAQETELPGWGLTAQDLTPELARQRRIRDLDGALVTGVKTAAPAEIAGIRQGDIVRWIEGRRVSNTEDLLEAYGELREKAQVLVKSDRGTTIRLAVVESLTH